MRQFSQTGLRTQAESSDETYKRPLQDKHQKKATQRGVKDVNSTISDLNGESSGCGGHIFYFFPRDLCNSSSEMSQVPCDFTLSLISPAVSLFEQFF